MVGVRKKLGIRIRDEGENVIGWSVLDGAVVVGGN